jgi:ABC-2 type transport system ATP-binding protein
MSLIEIQSLSRSYGTRRGVENVHLSVPEGTLFGFLGPNGAGKTTTIRVLVGLLRPTSGSARVFGLDCWRESAAIKREIGYVPGDLRLHGWLDGHAALAIWGRVRGRDLAVHGRELAERFGLDLATKVRSMSRGMRQKLGLILALAHRPRLLVLDEPTTTLDPLMQVTVQAILREMAAAGHTIFFSSHMLAEVEQLCQRVAIIRDGRLVADESLAELRRRAGHQVTIRWRDAQAAALAPPAGLELEPRQGPVWNGLFTGPLDELVAWLAGRPFDDLAIGHPDLDALFHHYYARERR